MQDNQALARQIRRDIVQMVCEAGSGHPGGSLSATDILVALYLNGVLAHNPEDPRWEGRDWFFLTKGHAAPALYATLARAGYFPVEELKTLRKLGSRLQGHPDSSMVPGVEVGTGSLGQGLSIAAGTACGLRLAGSQSTVFALMGDGECEEGQVWEAAMFAAHQQLGRLITIVDHNGLQIDGPVTEVCSPESLKEKFASFGWRVAEVDGHDINAITEVLNSCKAQPDGAPWAVIAETVKGKGVSFMENQAGWHGKAPNAEQCAVALAELGDE